MWTTLWAKRRAVLAYAVLLAIGWTLGTFLLDFVVPEAPAANPDLFGHMMLAGLLVFVLTAAIPFVPAAEIGLAILLVFGADAALPVYLCMVGALTLSYCAARLIPAYLLARALTWARLTRAADMILQIDAAEPLQRMALVSRALPDWLGPRLVRNRYLLLALAINVPGNTIAGGGGGLAFLAGASGLYGVWAYLATILIAVAPVPLFFFLMD